MNHIIDKPFCCFCKSANVKLNYKQRFHKFNKNHGPINFFKCLDCRSGFTYPLPTTIELAALYGSFDGGMIPETRDIRDNNPLNIWYNQCVDRAFDRHKDISKDDSFTWIDIGAGGGEVARIIAQRFPNSTGYALDYHTRPELLSGVDNVTWIQSDLNDKEFFKQIPIHNFKIAVCITVLEHVLYPYDFLGNIFRLLAQDGSMYLTVPDMGSVAAKTLRGAWPYLIFGEHLNIPSKKGMQILLKRFQTDNALSKQKNLEVAPVVLPYPVTYYLDHFGLKKVSSWFSKKNLIRINTGIMEAAVS